LHDRQGNPTSVVQLLSGLRFILGGGGSLSGASLSNSSGQEISVNSHGSFTLGSTVPTGWGFFPAFHDTNGFLDLVGGPADPRHLIIGPPGPGNTYSNAAGNPHGGIAGNTRHNPFLVSARFSITGPGITSTTTIDSAFFFFGLASIGVQGEKGQAVSEPSAALLLGLGTVGLMGLATASRNLIST